MVQVLEEQRQSLQKQLVELAVTGAAFDKLQQSEAMEQLLFFTRIFARFVPEQKASHNTDHTASVITAVLTYVHEPPAIKLLKQYGKGACTEN